MQFAFLCIVSLASDAVFIPGIGRGSVYDFALLEKAMATKLKVSPMNVGGAAVRSLALSPKGDFVACADRIGRIYVFETATGKKRHFLKPSKSEKGFLNVVFAKDNSLFACHCDPYLIQIRDVETGKCVRQFEGAWGWGVKPRDGTFLVGINSDDDDVLKIWDWDGPKERVAIKMNRPLEEGQSDLCDLAFSPDGKFLATSGSHTPLEIWDSTSGKLIRKFTKAHQQFTCVAFSPDSQTIAAADANGLVRLWDTKKGALTLRIQATTKRIQQIRFSPNGKFLASCGDEDIVRFFDPTTGKPSLIIKTGEFLDCVAFSPDSKIMFSGGENAIRKWDTGTGAEVGGKNK